MPQLQDSVQNLPWPVLPWKLSTMLSLVIAYDFHLYDQSDAGCFEHIEDEAVELEVWTGPKRSGNLYVIRLEPNACTITCFGDETVVRTEHQPDWVIALANALHHLKYHYLKYHHLGAR